MLKKGQELYREFSKNFGVTPPEEAAALTSAREICISIRDSHGESLFKDKQRKRQPRKEKTSLLRAS